MTKKTRKRQRVYLVVNLGSIPFPLATVPADRRDPKHISAELHEGAPEVAFRNPRRTRTHTTVSGSDSHDQRDEEGTQRKKQSSHAECINLDKTGDTHTYNDDL